MPGKNNFLKKEKKVLALIGKIIGGRKTALQKKKQGLLRRIDNLIDEQLLDALNEARLEKELEFSDKLKHLSNKIEQFKKVRVLEHRAIIGVGGQFSVGKSTFINSLLGKEAILPQKVSITTSISTYIICGDKYQNSAYTKNDQFVILDDEEYKALTHEFTKEHIGVSGFVDNIILERPGFMDNIVSLSSRDEDSDVLWRNIALLDTPGYNKAKGKQQERFTDRKQAAQQLENADFIIWLLSVENGDLSESDSVFLFESLGRKLFETPEQVLIVINKANKKTPTRVGEILEQVKDTLYGQGVSEECLVTVYDSFDREELFQKNHIPDFLKKAADYGRVKSSLKDELRKINKEIKKYLEESLDEEERREKDLYEAILYVEHPEFAGSFVDFYHRTILRQRVIRMCYSKFQNVIKQINDDLRVLKR